MEIPCQTTPKVLSTGMQTLFTGRYQGRVQTASD